MATSNSGKKTATTRSAPRKTSAGTTANKSGTSRSRTKNPPAPAKDPIRNRGAKAFLLLALAIFSLIGCFTGEGIFIGAFREFMMGLIGKGFYFLPVALAYCAVMLVYVRDRPLGGADHLRPAADRHGRSAPASVRLHHGIQLGLEAHRQSL